MLIGFFLIHTNLLHFNFSHHWSHGNEVTSYTSTTESSCCRIQFLIISVSSSSNLWPHFHLYLLTFHFHHTSTHHDVQMWNILSKLWITYLFARTYKYSIYVHTLICSFGNYYFALFTLLIFIYFDTQHIFLKCRKIFFCVVILEELWNKKKPLPHQVQMI